MFAIIFFLVLFAVICFFKFLPLIIAVLLAKLEIAENNDSSTPEDDSESDYTSWAYLPGSFAE